MKIIYEPLKFFNFAFEYEFSYDILNFCRKIKDSYGWKKFNFYESKWRFNDPLIIEDIKLAYPNIEIDPSVLIATKEKQIQEEQKKVDEAKLIEIKNKKKSDLVIPGFKGELYDYQKIGVEFLLLNKGRGMLFDQPGLGKELFVDTKILTNKGWKKIGEIKKGEVVFDRNGNETMVTGVYPQGVKPLFRMTFSDGSSCLAGKDHRWIVRSRNMIRRKTGWKVLTTNDLMKRKLCDKRGGRVRSSYMIPFANPPKTKKADLPISPYTLGALIGDGALSGASILISIPDNKKSILEKIKLEYPEYSYHENPNGCPQFGLTTKGGKSHYNKIKRDIASIGLNVLSRNRFIPNEYKVASTEQRVDLLRGLMDTDGSNVKKRTTFHTVSRRLADDVAEIVRSVGGEAVIREYDRKEKGVEFQVNVRSHLFCPFSEDSYKRKGWTPPFYRGKTGRFIRSIEYEKDGEAVCISVDNSEELYVIEDYIVTHNTSQSLGYIVAANKKKSLIICPASVKPSWKKEIEKWTKLKSIILDSKTEIDVKVLSKYDVFIINYDSLKTFFDVGTVQKLTSTGKIKKTKVFKLKDLFNVFSFDCLIADEAQMIKELSAGRTRMTRMLSDKVESVILLSGTPIMNRPKELFSMLNIIDKKTWGNFMDYTKRYCDGHYGQFGWECDGASNLDELRSRISHYFLRRLKKDVASQLPPKRFIDIPVELEYEQRIAYDKAERDLVEFLRKYKGKTDEEIQKSMQAEKLVLLNSLRYTTSMGKIDAARDIINNLIENDEKVLVFSVYNEPLEVLYKEFEKGAVMITGKTPQSERGEAVEKFQNDKNTKVFFGGTKSAGTGITLTAASNVIFLDFSWVPADHEQALDRCFFSGNKVLTRKGWIPIEKIKKGDYVLSASGKENKVIDNWSKYARNGNEALTTRISISGWEDIVCTYNHRFLLKSGEWKEANNLIPGDVLKMPGCDNLKETPFILFDKDCRVEKTFFHKTNNNIQRKGNLSNVKIPKRIRLTDDFLFILGYYAGDGFSSIMNNKGRFVSFAGNNGKKKKHLDLCRKFFVEQGIAENERIDGKGIERRYYNQEWAMWFFKNFGHRAKNKRLPKFLLTLNERQSLLVLDGLIESDGYRRYGAKHVEYSTTSETLASHVFILATRCGFRPSLRIGTTGEHIIGFTMEKGFLHSNTPGQVKSVLLSFSDKKEKVYDITVENEENFVVGGVVVHNCHRWGQKADEITCYQLYADKTVDEKMKTLLETKKFIADTVIDGGEDSSSHSKELISELLKSFSNYD